MSKLNLMKANIEMVALEQFGYERNLRDPDVTARALLSESFGNDDLPRPFVVKTHEQHGLILGTVLAYTPMSEDELRDVAKSNQQPIHTAILDPYSISTVQVPDDWYEGQQVLFDVRVTPIMRSARNGERDVYIDAPPGSTKEEVYCEWLSGLMLRQGCLSAEPDAMEIVRFEYTRVRRTMKSPWITTPDATIQGSATVVDPDKLMQALSGGIGRHKAYGYGMLLVRDAGSESDAI